MRWCCAGLVAFLILALALFDRTPANAADQSDITLMLDGPGEIPSWQILYDKNEHTVILLLTDADKNNGADLVKPEARAPERIPFNTGTMRQRQHDVLTQDLKTRLIIEVRRLTKDSLTTPDDPRVTPEQVQEAQKAATMSFVYNNAGIPTWAGLFYSFKERNRSNINLGHEQTFSRNLVVNSNIGPLNIDWLTSLGIHFLGAQRQNPRPGEVLLVYWMAKGAWGKYVGGGKKYYAEVGLPQDRNARYAVEILARSDGKIGIQHFLDDALRDDLVKYLAGMENPRKSEQFALRAAELPSKGYADDSWQTNSRLNLLQYDHAFVRAGLIAGQLRTELKAKKTVIVADNASQQVATRVNEELGILRETNEAKIAEIRLSLVDAKPLIDATGPPIPMRWTASYGEPRRHLETRADHLAAFVPQEARSVAVFGSDPATDLIEKGLRDRYGDTIAIRRYYDFPSHEEQQRQAHAIGADVILGIDSNADRKRRQRREQGCSGDSCNGEMIAADGFQSGGDGCAGQDCGPGAIDKPGGGDAHAGPGGVLVNPAVRRIDGADANLPISKLGRCDFSGSTACRLD